MCFLGLAFDHLTEESDAREPRPQFIVQIGGDAGAQAFQFEQANEPIAIRQQRDACDHDDHGDD